MNQFQRGVSRRRFVASAGIFASGVVAGLPISATAFGAAGRGNGRLRVGVIGCGGRGTGAAVNMLEASPDTEIVALADAFPDQIASCRSALAGIDPALASRVTVIDDRCFAGLDAYRQLLALDVDLAILAGPPGFRPLHFAAAVEKGCHVFMEKPVAVDPAGVRAVIAAANAASERKLSVVSGTQRRHERSYLEAMRRVHDGSIGPILAARCYWNQGGLWHKGRKPEWSDAEWQMRNWLYFCWLSGDHIVEQHVHNIDVLNWAFEATPVRCWAMGGREVRTDPMYGDVFDHFAVEFEYPSGAVGQSYCRQIEGTASRVEEVLTGSGGTMVLSSGRARSSGASPWKFEGENPNPYIEELRDLVRSVTGGPYLNEGVRIAHSTLTAIMGRMAAYTGKIVTWEQAINSSLDTMPKGLAFGPLPVGPVPVPGKTPLI